MKWQNIILRHAAGEYWLVVTKQYTGKYIPPVKINECGALIFACLKQGLSNNEIADRISSHYGVQTDEALEDVKYFIIQLEQCHIVDYKEGN